MGVTVTFVAILELVREGLIDIVQTEAYAPLHVRGAQGAQAAPAVDNDSARQDARNGRGQGVCNGQSAPGRLRQLASE